MHARICTNPQCRTILPYHTCSLCQTATEPLPLISLGLTGIDGTARLIHTPPTAYSILLILPSGHHTVNVSLRDLVHSAQAHLPLVEPVTGLMIMDSLDNAATLLRSKNTGHWPGWILYLLEALQDHANTHSFRQVLQTLLQDLNTNLLDSHIPPEDP